MQPWQVECTTGLAYAVGVLATSNCIGQPAPLPPEHRGPAPHITARWAVKHDASGFEYSTHVLLMLAHKLTKVLVVNEEELGKHSRDYAGVMAPV